MTMMKEVSEPAVNLRKKIMSLSKAVSVPRAGTVYKRRTTQSRQEALDDYLIAT